jgi:hypothetical protein
MKNFKALALTALTALTLAAPAQARQGDMAPMEYCKDIYRQAAYDTECYVHNFGYRTVEQYIQEFRTPAAPAQPAGNNTADFIGTLMNGLNDITGAAVGTDFNGLANTNTTVEGPCATGTNRFGNTVCTDNNGVVQYEIRRDGRGNQQFIDYRY